MTSFETTKQNLKGSDIDSLLEEIQVLEPHTWGNLVSKSLSEWWAVTTDLGIIAYFGCELDAHRFRIDYINRIMNS